MMTRDEFEISRLNGFDRTMPIDEFWTAYDQNFDKTVRLLMRLGCNWGDAMDLAQDAWLHGLEKLDKLRDRQALVPWVFKIAVSKRIDRIRRSKPQTEINENGSHRSLQVQPTANDKIMDLMHAFEACWSRDVAILWSVKIEGKSIEAVAKEVATTKHAVDEAMTRARKVLRKWLMAGGYSTRTKKKHKLAA